MTKAGIFFPVSNLTMNPRRSLFHIFLCSGVILRFYLHIEVGGGLAREMRVVSCLRPVKSRAQVVAVCAVG